MTFAVDIAAIVPWPKGDAVTVCAWLTVASGEPFLVVQTGASPMLALQAVFVHAAAICKLTAFARN